MSFKSYKHYREAEEELCRRIVTSPQFITSSTFEILGTGFVLTEPWNNKNGHSNYEYAEEFFKWMMTGEKDLSQELLRLNPWVKRFVDTTGLPETFSTSYGWKIKSQIEGIILELKKFSESRRAYFNILTVEDKKVIELPKSTMEYPCTIGVHLFIRDGHLHMIVNMRSNNVYSVMPYDVYNFTCLQFNLADKLDIPMGTYTHQINSAHLYKGDVRRLKELYYAK